MSSETQREAIEQASKVLEPAFTAFHGSVQLHLHDGTVASWMIHENGKREKTESGSK